MTLRPTVQATLLKPRLRSLREPSLLGKCSAPPIVSRWSGRRGDIEPDLQRYHSKYDAGGGQGFGSRAATKTPLRAASHALTAFTGLAAPPCTIAILAVAFRDSLTHPKFPLADCS